MMLKKAVSMACGFWRNGRNDLKQLLGVGNALWARPIGKKYLLFDPCAVKGAEGKTVDCENVGIVFKKPILKHPQVVTQEELSRGKSGKPKANWEGFADSLAAGDN